MRHQITLLAGFLILMALLVIAATTDVDLIVPPDNFYDLDGNISDYIGVSSDAANVAFYGLVNTIDSFNISNVSLMTNFTGDFQRNNSNTSFLAFKTIKQNVSFTWDLNLTDGTHLTWAIEVCVNSTTNMDNCTVSSNRTLFVEFPPIVTIDSPNENDNMSTPIFGLNFTVKSDYVNSDTSQFTCEAYAGTSGDFNVQRRFFNVENNTATNTTVGIADTQSLALGVICWEEDTDPVFAWATNITVNVDTTAPVVTLLGSNRTGHIFNTGNVLVNWSIVETNPARCELYTNASGSWVANDTYDGVNIVSGSRINISFDGTEISDGDYIVGGFCWDYAGANTTLENFTFTVDTIAPVISNAVNISVGQLLTVKINWSTDEPTNGSIIFGQNISELERADSTSVNATDHSINISVVEHTTYFYNITTCDAAGNCNSSDFQYEIQPMSGIYAGWNAYGIFDASLSMATIYNDSGADFVYWWNSSGQSWLSHVGGSGTNADHDILGGDVVWLFKSTGGTWRRNLAEPSTFYIQNLSTGVNFVSAQRFYDFDNFTKSFTNYTAAEQIATGFLVGGTSGGIGAQNIDISEVEFFAYWNNSDQRYVSHFLNETFNNNTFISYGDAVFVGTPLNISWNSTAVISNWTLIR